MKESTIESKTVNYAKSKAWLVYKFTSPGNKAVPDRIFIRNSVVFFIEFKALGRKPTKLQKKVHDDINSHQVPVYVIDNFLNGKELIDSFEKGRNDSYKNNPLSLKSIDAEKGIDQSEIMKTHAESNKFGLDGMKIIDYV